MYRSRIEKVRHYVAVAYRHVDKFVSQFEPILALYWENQRMRTKYDMLSNANL